MDKTVWVLHGPNLNLLGKRQPEIYGNVSFDDYFTRLQTEFPQHELVYFQSNHEGALIDFLQENSAGAHGLVINAGGLTHTSVSLAESHVKTWQKPSRLSSASRFPSVLPSQTAEKPKV
jgi:3-dehydroquinate dehydratase-2